MNLFAYGTLMWPAVLASVTGLQRIGEPGVLKGYRRLRVIGEDYPVIVPSPQDSVAGILYRDLPGKAFDALDRFEGEPYDRLIVLIGDTEASVYVLAPGWGHIASAECWKPEQMTTEKLEKFCSEYPGWTES